MVDKSTRTYVSLLCLTSVLSLVTFHVGKVFMKWVGTSREEDQHLGDMVSALFMLLAIQTGLPLLNPSKRLIRLYYNLSLTFLASMHYIHSMMHYKLQTLTLISFSLIHLRQLILAFFLFTVTSFFLIHQWSNNVASTWLLSVLAFGSELIVKIVFSVFIYIFILIDVRTRFAGEKTDDYVYYMTFLGKLIEFLFGLFLFGNGVWMVLFESAGLLRVVIMCAHLYFNIWKEAKQLYTTCSKKREVATKVAILKTASIDLIKNYNDICAICYSNLELHVVKVTSCKHLFHESCLCKWIPLSDACPVCHRCVFNV
ncbi:hypothetical protein HELRODRAFT_65586 [Helobdella robusta]|uniref:RING-type domain-containing protein n=1 Tax=Helobdella robusta TaxID=6412 RepID=T1FYA2_HELRO|nr:hypothetical protein HELRODRAFT_65586 [Helobdella robusta]ESO02051.1 hypothetical protein HELRODRAFT_65586 [Helobdella robusta]